MRDLESARWQTVVLRAFLILFFVWMVRAYAAPVLIGGIGAVVLAPVHRRLCARLGNAMSALLLTVATLTIAVVPLGIVAFRAAVALNGFLSDEWAVSAERIRTYFSDHSGILATLGFSGEELSEATDSLVQTLAGGLARAATSLVTAIPEQIIALFLMCASVYYFLFDGPRFVGWIERALPFPDEENRSLLVSIRDTIKGIVIGLLATAVVQGGLTCVALLLFGVPAAFALGVIAGLLSFIPLLGTTPVTVGAVIYLVTAGRIEAAAGMGIAAVVIGVSDNLVRPWLMHVATPSQHPLLILLGVFGGVSALGAPGVFLGPIIAAVAAFVALHATGGTAPAPSQPEPPGDGGQDRDHRLLEQHQ
jgi:predicted PurR-regulated permease PerM